MSLALLFDQGSGGSSVFFETVGLALCSCVLLGMAAFMALLALVNFRFFASPVWGPLDRLAWLGIAAAPVVVIVCIIAAWVALISGNSSGSVVATAIALVWMVVSVLVFFRRMGKPAVRVWTSRQSSSSPDVIIYPALPGKDKEPPGEL